MADAFSAHMPPRAEPEDADIVHAGGIGRLLERGQHLQVVELAHRRHPLVERQRLATGDRLG